MGSECRRKEQSGGRRMREWLIYYAEERQLHYIEGHNNNLHLDPNFYKYQLIPINRIN